MKCNIIVAFCKNGGIGLNNKLCWSIKSDLLKFSKLTRGNGKNAIIMGKNTYFSLPKNPSKKNVNTDQKNGLINDSIKVNNHSLFCRDNLILSSTMNLDFSEERNMRLYHTKTFSQINELLKYCDERDYDNIWIIGGAAIYDLFMNKEIQNKYNIEIIEIHTTEIDADFNCDTFFPMIDTSQYRCIKKDFHDEKFWTYYGFKIYDKIYKIYNE